jgi:hypothetical protein
MTPTTRRTVAICSLILLIAVVVPPLVSLRHFRSTIDQSLSRALGRQVTVENISLQLLPQPGFNLNHLVVADDPSFSAEPLIRADEVTAYLRSSSLWRGRLEIAQLSLKEPSLNLVRRPDGQWNVYALLERTARTPSAPTAQTKPESRLRFPYIEAEGGRINFKLGQEKKVYALMDADFALWLASENHWDMRLVARPVRTDVNLSDTGSLKLNGSLQRASALRDTPVHLNLVLEHAQLGQLTNLIYGHDRGWRGTVTLSAQLLGTPANLAVRTRAAIQDFRRYDIISDDSLRVAASCSASFSSVDQTWSGIKCEAPVGRGLVTVTGSLAKPLAGPTYDLKLIAHQVAMTKVVTVARHAKRDLPQDLAATGALDATLVLSKASSPDSHRMWTGHGQTSNFRLLSESSGDDLELGTIPFAVASTRSFAAALARKSAKRKTFPAFQQPVQDTSPELGIAVGPFPVELGGTTPAIASASLSRSGYSVTLQGDSQVKQVLEVARTLGVRITQPAANGSATLNLQIAGPWVGFHAPVVTGNAQLHNVTARVADVAAPLEITSANLLLTPEQTQLQSLVATFAGSDMHLSGSAAAPRDCPSSAECPVRLVLKANQIVASELNRLFNQHRPWYHVLLREPQSSVFARILLSGSIAAEGIAIGPLTANHASASLSLSHGRLQLSNVQCDLWGGKNVAELQADFTRAQPDFTVTGNLNRAALGEISAALGKDWATGVAFLRYRATLSGWSESDLLGSLNSSADFDVRDALLRHISLDETSNAMRVRRFSGQVKFENGQFRIVAGKLLSSGGIYKVSGTALINKRVDIKLVRDSSHVFSITGTLAAPKVAVVPRPQTEAALTP